MTDIEGEVTAAELEAASLAADLFNRWAVAWVRRTHSGPLGQLASISVLYGAVQAYIVNIVKTYAPPEDDETFTKLVAALNEDAARFADRLVGRCEVHKFDLDKKAPPAG